LTEKEFRYIYNQFFEGIRGYLFYRSGNTELSTDIAQETFIRVWEKQFNYEPKKTKSLLYKISGDMFLSHLRREKIANEYLKEIKFNLKEEDTNIPLESAELLQTYEIALAKLPEKQRTVFLMNRMEDLSYKEIAERLQISVKAVEKRMSAALLKLRSMIKI